MVLFRTMRSWSARWGVPGGIIVFAIALVLQLGMWPVFEVQRYIIRSEMKEMLLLNVPKDDLVEFRFTQEQYAVLEFEDGGREVWLNGVMHDIVRSTRHADGSIHMHVVRDDAETALVAELERKVQAAHNAEDCNKEQRRILTLMWPGFIDTMPIGTFVLQAAQRFFPIALDGIGGPHPMIDPGPPRPA